VNIVALTQVPPHPNPLPRIRWRGSAETAKQVDVERLVELFPEFGGDAAMKLPLPLAGEGWGEGSALLQDVAEAEVLDLHVVVDALMRSFAAQA
jgi:hypothetical protein